jgi:hypothetical protein
MARVYACSLALRDDLDRAARAALAFAEAGEELAGVVPAEAEPDERTYLSAYRRGEEHSWLVLDAAGAPVADRAKIRRTASIVGLCELAEESAGGGELDELRERLVSLRLTEHPEGIEEAEAAALDLQRALGAPPRIAEPSYLDRVGAATRRLEQALGESPVSPFAEAMKRGQASVEELERDVLAKYKVPLA